MADPSKKYALLMKLHLQSKPNNRIIGTEVNIPGLTADMLGLEIRDKGLNANEKALVNAVEHGGKYTPDTMTLTAALAHDNERRGADRQARSYNVAVKSFVESQGDLDIIAIKPVHVLAYISQLQAKGNKPATVNKRLANLSTLLKRVFRDFEIEKSNPFQSRKVKDDVEAQEKVDPFTADQIATLDHHLATSNAVDLDAKAILNIIRNTGAGPAEIAGLKVSDVRIDGAFPHINLEYNNIRRLKVPQRIRTVPLVGVALDAAKSAVARATGKALFNSIKIGSKSTIAVMNNKLNLTITKAGIEGVTVYSLRHCLIDAMRIAEVNDYLQLRLIGQGGKSVKDKTYGTGEIPMSHKTAAVEKALPILGKNNNLDNC